ncbi:glycosyl hydrolase family 25 [Prevotella sp. CAG:520]|nr:glycosyl hydrolase family 25 [Prevotella sp. CAG:520]
MKAIRYTLALCLALLCLCGCNDIPHDGEAIIGHGATTYYGGTKQGKYDGYGVLSVGDSVVYAGQWRMGKRCGKGISHDSLGHRIVGRWRADTLVSGTWRDSTGTYSGTLNRDAIACGHGTFTDRKQNLYQGEWTDGKRNGFGFALTAGKHMQLGEWKRNRFLGERIEYRADRIYGIDISRFQHEKGRKRYAIDWKRVRITNLGKLSRKRIAGAVDYPVSFCYIKSTEGATIKNRTTGRGGAQQKRPPTSAPTMLRLAPKA